MKTPQSLYSQRHVEAVELVAALRRNLDAHKTDAGRDGPRWDHAGDLGRVVEALRDLVAFTTPRGTSC